ncbi:MAG: response regulator [Bosea sp. (in: a-proteobacteria)]
MLDFGIAIMAGLSLILCGIAILAFSALRDRQDALVKTIREDTIWAAYQIDSELKKLSLALNNLERDADRNSRDQAVLRYDILYSRAELIVGSHYAQQVSRNSGLAEAAADLRRRILDLAPAADQLKDAVPQEASRLIADLRQHVTSIGTDSERFLNGANLAQGSLKTQERLKVSQSLSEVGLVVGLLIAILAIIVVYLGTQLRLIRISRDKLAILTVEKAEAARLAEAGARAKSIFLATMSHEIRTPLNGIIGSVDLLRDDAMTAEQRARLQVVADCSDMLLALIDDILDFTKLESGAIEFEKEVVDLKVIVDAVVEVMRPRAQAKGVALSIDCAPARIVSDPTRLRQILFNLVGNAIKFTAEGRVAVSCRIEQGMLTAEITDTGIGIDPAMRDRLFKDFSQVDVTINRRFGGTGLGLAICHRIVTALGGRIGMHAVRPRGSCFWFSIPATLAKAEAKPIQPELERGPFTLPIDRPLRVLLAEDNAINSEVATEILTRLGISVDHAENGDVAIELATARRYDAVLMDMQMPGTDGLAATTEIRRRGIAVPIIALTSNAHGSDRQLCLSAGMDAFVAKPINRQKLQEALHPWLWSAASARPASQHSQPPTLKTVQLIDQATRLELCEALGADSLDALTTRFWSDAASMISSTKTSIAEQRAADAIRELHTLKGVAGTLGLIGIETAAGAAEATLRASGAVDTQALQAMIQQTCLAEAELASRPSGAPTPALPTLRRVA